jgi:hypothetical protein
MLRHRTIATAVVLSFSFCLQRRTMAPSCQRAWTKFTLVLEELKLK